MNKKEADAAFGLMTAHLKAANDLAIRLGVYLGHVNDLAPLRGKSDEVIAKVLAKRAKTRMKHYTNQNNQTN